MCKAAEDLLTNVTDQSITRSRKILPLTVEWDTYRIISDYEIVNMLNTDLTDLRISPTQVIMDKCINRLSSALYKAAKDSTQRDVDAGIPEGVILPFTILLDECDDAMRRFLSGQTRSEDWNAIRSVVLQANKHFNDTLE